MSNKCCNNNCNQGRDCPERRVADRRVASAPSVDRNSVLPYPTPMQVAGEPDESFYRRIVYVNGWNECLAAINRAPQPVDAAHAVPECAMCNDKGAVGNAPDEFQECPDCIAARAAAPRSITGAMLSAAGRALADRSAAACNVDKDDNWMVYGNDFIDDAEAALIAAGLTVAQPTDTTKGA